MGWQLIHALAAADLPDSPVTSDSSQGVTVALIGVLSTVVATIGAVVISTRASRTTASPPAADPRLGERVAVTETEIKQDHRSFNALDRFAHGLGAQVEDHEHRLRRLEERAARDGEPR